MDMSSDVLFGFIAIGLAASGWGLGVARGVLRDVVLGACIGMGLALIALWVIMAAIDPAGGMGI